MLAKFMLTPRERWKKRAQRGSWRGLGCALTHLPTYESSVSRLTPLGCDGASPPHRRQTPLSLVHFARHVTAYRLLPTACRLHYLTAQQPPALESILHSSSPSHCHPPLVVVTINFSRARSLTPCGQLIDLGGHSSFPFRTRSLPPPAVSARPGLWSGCPALPASQQPSLWQGNLESRFLGSFATARFRRTPLTPTDFSAAHAHAHAHAYCSHYWWPARLSRLRRSVYCFDCTRLFGSTPSSLHPVTHFQSSAPLQPAVYLVLLEVATNVALIDSTSPTILEIRSILWARLASPSHHHGGFRR